VFLAAVPAAHGQTPTPEGTVIRNTATVSFTDANDNTYADVEAFVEVTVGFQAGIDVIAGAATATPVSASTDNDLTFTIDNIGNGNDSVTVGVAISDATVVTNVRYVVGGSTYGSLSALNDALAATAITTATPLDVIVRYDVPSGRGGVSSTITFTATSRRDASEDGSDATVVTPPITGTIDVSPDGGAVDRLPSNLTSYTATFSVSNDQTGADDLDLVASVNNGNVTIVSVNGEAGDSARVAFTSGQAQNIDVVYTVADVAAGSTATITLNGRSVANPATSNTGDITVTVVRPSISVTKQAWDDGLSGQISGEVLPGQYIQYRIDVTNGGTAEASDISVSDVLPAQVTYDSHSDDGGTTPAWVITESSGTVTATLDTLGTGATRTFWIRVRIN
jgi:uncharacterized repeat protein (TIGR01451 family)